MNPTHTNSEGERISIEERQLRGKPVKCLVLYDDPPPMGSGRPAPMLLDEGTRQWLLEQLSSRPESKTIEERLVGPGKAYDVTIQDDKEPT